MVRHFDFRWSRVTLSVGLSALLACGGSSSSSPSSQSASAAADQDGDGVTVQQGDCDDRNPSVKPGGGFDLKFEYGRSGFLQCSVPSTEFRKLTVTNNSCEALTIIRLERLQEDCILEPVVGDYTSTIPLRTVQPGSAMVVHDVPPYQEPFDRCCCVNPVIFPNGTAFCRLTGLCTASFTFTLTTSGGVKTAQQSWTIDPKACPRCPASDICL